MWRVKWPLVPQEAFSNICVTPNVVESDLAEGTQGRAMPQGECWARAGSPRGPVTSTHMSNRCPPSGWTEQGSQAPAPPHPQIPGNGNLTEKPPSQATAVKEQGRRTSCLSPETGSGGERERSLPCRARRDVVCSQWRVGSSQSGTLKRHPRISSTHCPSQIGDFKFLPSCSSGVILRQRSPSLDLCCPPSPRSVQEFRREEGEITQ